MDMSAAHIAGGPTFGPNRSLYLQLNPRYGDRLRRTNLAGLEARALSQGGYFDRSDVLAHGLTDELIHYHVKVGRFRRVIPGVYRRRAAPIHFNDQDLQAWVWTNYRGAISHESAPAVHDLSDVIPNRVHVTVPGRFHRTTAPVIVHLSGLPEDEVETRDGFRVTTPARSIVDAAFGGTDPSQVQRAVREALDRAVATPEEIRAALERSGYRRHRQDIRRLIADAVDTADR
jgi:predicted transcriptional regulator of viral defense system